LITVGDGLQLTEITSYCPHQYSFVHVHNILHY